MMRSNYLLHITHRSVDTSTLPDHSNNLPFYHHSNLDNRPLTKYKKLTSPVLTLAVEITIHHPSSAVRQKSSQSAARNKGEHAVYDPSARRLSQGRTWVMSGQHSV